MDARVAGVLGTLVGRALVRFAFACDLLALQFGPWRTRITREGEARAVGAVALHVQTAWRLVGPRGLVAGRLDALEEPRPELGVGGPSLAHQRLARWFRDAAVLTVARVDVDDAGGFALRFVEGYRLDVVPVGTAPQEEHWRLLLDGGAHAVMGVDGLEILPPASEA